MALGGYNCLVLAYHNSKVILILIFLSSYISNIYISFTPAFFTLTLLIESMKNVIKGLIIN
jgi:hypothetical protein